MKKIVLFILLFTSFRCFAQSVYNPAAVFPAQPILPQGNEYRTATGRPGPKYWQNKVDYIIDVTLNDTNQTLHGKEIITYTNNSPETLTYVWLQLDEDAYKLNSRARLTRMLTDSNESKTGKGFDGGFIINSVTAKQQSLQVVHSDARMKVILNEPLPSGAGMQLSISFSYAIPQYFHNNDFGVNRTDILPTRNGNIYSIAQWYPRLCVLDDVEGWNTLPFLGNGEFYLEYGNFNVNITLPSAYVVQASGELTNPQEVLSATELQRWKAAKNSEKGYFIHAPEDVTNASIRPDKPTCTWKFSMLNTRDFAWAASKAFVWEGVNINLPNGKKAFGISVYPIESMTPDSWQHSSEYVKFTVENFSKRWFIYPYPCAVNVASNLDGMEFPGIVFCPAFSSGNMYWRVVNHELGHTWFPMIVGSNERRYAWMDEGFNTFIDNIAREDFEHGKFTGYEPHDRPIESYFADSVPPVMTKPDAMMGDMVFHTQYLKVTYALRLLRDNIIGKDLFDSAFKQYIRDWAFRHPTPNDFFHSIDNGTGEDLGWFWKAMFMENYKLDQSIKSVKYVDGDATKGAIITIENKQQAAMPVIVEVKTKNGKTETYRLPVEIWQTGDTYELTAATKSEVAVVTIDPENMYPDADRNNNIWKQ
ncbi:M1 family metallopeptidase [Parafilimonas sp.]|uniref:M1 family metallopeptidase n=1 Tax=Parafilimonas sp. TaxID=1969739 RepID=UPI0039E46649